MPWIVPEIGLTIIGMSLFPAYMSIFAHLADVYEIYASSALAAQSLARNIAVGTFVLFAQPMFKQFPRPAGSSQSTSYALASTLLAGMGAILGTVPFILYKYGEGLRRRSKIASQIWAADDAAAEKPSRPGSRSNQLAVDGTVREGQEENSLQDRRATDAANETSRSTAVEQAAAREDFNMA